jgi:hypothetical protein
MQQTKLIANLSGVEIGCLFEGLANAFGFCFEDWLPTAWSNLA